MANKLCSHPSVFFAHVSLLDVIKMILNFYAKIGGYSGTGGVEEKIRRLRLENVIIRKRRIVDFARRLFVKFIY